MHVICTHNCKQSVDLTATSSNKTSVVFSKSALEILIVTSVFLSFLFSKSGLYCWDVQNMSFIVFH